MLPSVLHASFSRWVRICEIVIAHASLIRQFWFWDIMFRDSAFGRGVISTFAAAALLRIGYLTRRI